MININISSQILEWTGGNGDSLVFPVSTALNGTGQLHGSQQTPLGLHRIDVKIGQGLPAKSVFVGRRWTGEVYTSALGETFPGRDWILSRILWLKGLEPGLNRGGLQDSRRRYIYLHGTDQEHLIGTPCSHGCIRMKNADIIELFERVNLGEQVHIFL